MLNFLIKNNKAQGLIETIIAIGIIITGLSSAMSLIVQNKIATEEAEDRLIATNLAREGVEIVRNIRDTNWLSCEMSGFVPNCNDWDQDLYSGNDVIAVPVFNPLYNSWIIDFAPDSIQHDYARIWRKNGGTSEFIGVQFNSNEPTPPDSTLTNFRRILELYSICSDKSVLASCPTDNPKIGIRVQSKVLWNSRGRESTIVIEERLFNWR
jgi:hypothetical protein